MVERGAARVHDGAVRIHPVLPAFAILSLATSCVGPPRAAVAPSAPLVRMVAPPPPAARVALPTDWRDWPQTPGDWRYVASGGTSSATYGADRGVIAFLTCDRPTRRMALGVTANAASPIVVRTSSTTRTLGTVLRGGSGLIPPATAQADLAADDPLLDAIGFSRGRFVVEQPGAPALVLPAWAEVERVIEDCRG